MEWGVERPAACLIDRVERVTSAGRDACDQRTTRNFHHDLLYYSDILPIVA